MLTQDTCCVNCCAAWGTQAADATSRLDVAAAAARTAKAIPVVASLLEKQIMLLAPSQPTVVATVADIFDSAALDSFKRLWQRCKLTGIDFWRLLWHGSAADWELCITKSFAAGASMNLDESTITQQVSQAAFTCIHAGFNNCFTACQLGAGEPLCERMCWLSTRQGSTQQHGSCALGSVLTLLLPTTGAAVGPF
jgi:hypothetical protein